MTSEGLVAIGSRVTISTPLLNRRLCLYTQPTTRLASPNVPTTTAAIAITSGTMESPAEFSTAPLTVFYIFPQTLFPVKELISDIVMLHPLYAVPNAEYAFH